MAVILKLGRRKILLLATYSYVIIEFKVMKQINKTNINASDQNGSISQQDIELLSLAPAKVVPSKDVHPFPERKRRNEQAHPIYCPTQPAVELASEEKEFSKWI